MTTHSVPTINQAKSIHKSIVSIFGDNSALAEESLMYIRRREFDEWEKSNEGRWESPQARESRLVMEAKIQKLLNGEEA